VDEPAARERALSLLSRGNSRTGRYRDSSKQKREGELNEDDRNYKEELKKVRY